MSKKDKTHLYVMVAIILIAVAIAVYLLLERKAQAESGLPSDFIPGDEQGDVDPDIPPGYQMLPFDHTTKDSTWTYWRLNKESYATLLSGNVRVGGKVYTNVRIHVRSGGSWKHIGTVGGWPDGFTQFAYTINMKIEGVRWEAEQGLILPRYVDEVHAQLMVEV